MCKNLISRLVKTKGFTKIADSFEKRPFPKGGQIIQTSVQVGFIRYRRCAFILLDDKGIYIRIKYILKNFPTAFIPWNSIKETQKARLYGRSAIRFDFENHNFPSISLYEKDLKKFNSQAGKRYLRTP